MKIRVLLTRSFFPEDMLKLRAELHADVELVVPPEVTPTALQQAAAADIDVFLGDVVTRPMMERARKLRLIQVPWTGVDRMDFGLLREFGVPVCNSHSNANAVAEMAVGLMLAVAKKIPLHDRRLRQADWMRPRRGVPGSHAPSTMLRGRTALFVGFGAIARRTAALLSGFDMRFLATDARPIDPSPSPLAELREPDALCEMLPMADVVFVMVPLLPSTRALMDAKMFGRMGTHAYLINTSRGEVLDEESLYRVLYHHQIGGAAIDTWYQYPKPDKLAVYPSERFPFHELDNLVLSPHRAGYAEGELPHLDDVVENLNRLAAGKSPMHCVDLEAGF